MPRSTTKRDMGKRVLDVKHFEVVDMSKGDPWATLRCPRKDCKGEFKVERKRFKESREHAVGRSCPYCFRVSGLPGADLSVNSVIG
jgi:hypothetical protein